MNVGLIGIKVLQWGSKVLELDVQVAGVEVLELGSKLNILHQNNIMAGLACNLSSVRVSTVGK